MKTMALVLMFGLSATLAAPLSAEPPLKVLFIGNSQMSQYDRALFNIRGGMTMPEYRAAFNKNDSFVANPCMSAAPGFRQGWQQINDEADFDGFFATVPGVVMRGIGLQPEAFSDFRFKDLPKGWPYDAKWAAEETKGMEAAATLAGSGKNAEAAAAFADLAAKLPAPVSERLKTGLLDYAAQCAGFAKDYPCAMQLAKSMPLAPFAIRRQMALLVEQKKYAELIASFSNQAMGGAEPQSTWICPETEEVIADALYYRGLAYAETGNLAEAEADMRTMMDKGGRMGGYSPGDSILAVAWQRLGDFYRTYRKDDAKALETYRNALAVKSNPEISDALKSAEKSVAEMSRK